VSSTPRPKFLALVFLLGAFLTGGAVGYAADRAVSGGEREYTRKYDQRSMRAELARELRLNDAQREAVDSILDWRRDRERELMVPIRSELDKVRDSARVLIMQRLDDTQRADFLRLIERTRKPADSSAAATRGAAR
jgi:hypothetical protein